MPHIISKNIKPIAIIWLSRENTLFSSWAFFWKTPLGNEEEQGMTDRVSLWFTHPRSHFHFSHWNLSLCFFIVKVFKLWELLKWRAASLDTNDRQQIRGVFHPHRILYAYFNQKTSNRLGSSTKKRVWWWSCICSAPEYQKQSSISFPRELPFLPVVMKLPHI